MIDFIKWLIKEYRGYKITQDLAPTKEAADNIFLMNYNKCIEVGFTHEQVLALMNLFYKSEGGGQNE